MLTEICPLEECTGCASCASICPKQAIKMVADKHGFFYPEINQDQCVGCGLCVKHCHICENKKSTTDTKLIYGVQAKDERIRRESSSGGVVPVLARYFLKKNQAVVGAIFDSEFNVYEDICFSEDEYNAKGFIRSKYVQSETRDCFTKVKEALSMGKEVLFIGTPCQVAAIKAFTGEPESLYTVDFVCHGGPSSKVFQEYLKYQEDRYNSDITAVDFRIKKPSWSVSSIRLKFSNGKEYTGNMLEDPYCIAFTSNTILRQGCYQCKYAGPDRPGDITVCDFWGYKDKKDTLITDEKGTSVVIVNNEKGKQLFCELKDEFRVAERSFSEVSLSNEQLVRPNAPPKERDQFWDDFDAGIPFNELQRRYFPPMTRKMSKKDYLLMAYGNARIMRFIIQLYLTLKNVIKR